MGKGLQNNTPPEADLQKLPEQPEKQNSFLHRLTKSTRAAVFVAIGATLGGLASCSDKNPLPETPEPQVATQPTDENTPNDSSDPAKIDTAIKDTAEEIADACAKEEPKSVTEKLRCVTAGFLDPDHPQSAIGHFPDIKDLQQYDADSKPVARAWDVVKNQRKKIAEIMKLKIRPQAKRNLLKLAQAKLDRLRVEAERLQKEFYKKYGDKRPGKIAIFQRQPLTALKHMAVGEFLNDAVDEACGKAGLEPDECLLYHVMMFENSGGLWRGSPAGAVGPSQIMHQWFKWQETLTDNLKTENFWAEPGFDGRYDPIANIEMGARILKQEMKNFGREHPDFAVLAYNQGSGAVKRFVHAWAKSHRKNIPEFRTIRNWSSFLNQMGTNLATMMEDRELSKHFMPTNNGGRGYLSKILAIQLIADDPDKFGVEKRAIETLPIATDAEGKILYKWDEAFESLPMPAGESLRKFAARRGLNLGQLAFLNQQIRNIDARFSRPARIWVFYNSAPVPPALLAKMTRKILPLKTIKHPVKKPSPKIRKKSRHGKHA